MRHFITRQNWFYRLQQLIILALHLILLKWITFALNESGVMTTTEVMAHFSGMAIMGAALIRGCAAWAKYHHEKELENNASS